MRLCLVFIFLSELQILGLNNFNQGKDQTAVASLVPCLCLCMGTAITRSNHSKQTIDSIVKAVRESHSEIVGGRLGRVCNLHGEQLINIHHKLKMRLLVCIQIMVRVTQICAGVHIYRLVHEKKKKVSFNE